MMYRWILSSVVVLVLGSALLARPGTVTTHEGRVLEGEIREVGDSYVVSHRGIEVTVPRDRAQSVVYWDTLEQKYRERVAGLSKLAGPEAHLDIARWLFDNRAYDLAMQELDVVLKMDPNNRDAVTLIQTIQIQRRLERRPQKPAPAAPSDGQGEPQPTESAAPATQPASDRRYLTADEVNTIRQKELAPSDSSVRFRFENDVRRRFVQQAGAQSLAQFQSQPAAQQAQEILQRGTADMLRDLKVANDPAAMAQYRRSIQPMILSGCASSGCHGGAQAKGFSLFPLAENEQIAYTNFYILQQFVLNRDDAHRRMIDRANPEQSLLIQYGLPRGAAEHPHPDVVGFRPMLKGPADARYRLLVEWMGRSLNIFEPEYGIDYPLPWQERLASEPGARPQADADDQP